MHFHHANAASAYVRRARRFLALAEAQLPDTKIKTDRRRSALVLAVTAVDSNMHWLVYSLEQVTSVLARNEIRRHEQ